MRRPIIVVFFTLFLMAFGVASGAERGALFKVKANGHTLHLFGTIHVGRPDFYPLEPRLRDAVAAAPTLALEIDAAGNPAALVAAMQEHGMFAAGSPGYGALAPARRLRIEAALQLAGVDLARVQRLRPWMLASLLALGDAAKLGYQPELGLDAHLAQLVRERKGRILELETASMQAGMFSRLTDEQQWRLLEETLEMMASGRQGRELRELVAAYASADKAALDALMQRMEDDPGVTAKFTRELLLEERNGPMADKLALLIAREDNAVAAVGVLHLLGKRGLPELLRARGMTVERVY
jgi:uncharacterized protein YbaP (TraB family)